MFYFEPLPYPDQNLLSKTHKGYVMSKKNRQKGKYRQIIHNVIRLIQDCAYSDKNVWIKTHKGYVTSNNKKIQTKTIQTIGEQIRIRQNQAKPKQFGETRLGFGHCSSCFNPPKDTPTSPPPLCQQPGIIRRSFLAQRQASQLPGVESSVGYSGAAPIVHRHVG